MVQTKISETPEKGPNETELTNLPEREFKIKIINMMEIQKNIQKLRNEFKINIQSLRNSISEMKHTMEAFKNIIYSRRNSKWNRS